MSEPIGFLNLGWSYLRAAERVARVAKPSEFDGPIIMLIGRSVELMLKSYLWHAVDEKHARRFGQRIGDAFAETERLGLRVVCSGDEVSAFRHLDKLVSEQPFEARYLVTGAKRVFDAKSSFSLARKMMDAIEPALAHDRVTNVGRRTAMERCADVRLCVLPSPRAGEGSGMGGLCIAIRGATI